MRARTVALLASAGAAFAVILPALIRGEGIFPTALLSLLPPWNAQPHGKPEPLLVDQLLQFWPWRLFLWSELRRGHLPGWNPLNAAGVPFAGNVQAAPFSPLEWIGALTGPLAFSLIAAFAKTFVAGFGAATHALQLGAKRSGAALAGITFALCGFMTAWLGHPHTSAACLLPWLFVAIEARRGLPIVVALVLLAGHPPTEAHLLLAGGAYCWYRKYNPIKSVLLGAMLAAPATLPFLEYYAQSSASAASAVLDRGAQHLSPWELLFVFLPRAAQRFELDFASNALERAAWVGMPSLGLAILAWRKSRFHLALAIFGLAGALGLFFPVFQFLPINPTRLTLFFCFGVSILAGLADTASWKVAPIFLVPLLVAHTLDYAAFAEAAIAMAIVSLPKLRPFAPVAAAAALLYDGFGVNQTAPVEWLFPKTPLTEQLLREQGEGRIFAVGPMLAPDSALPLGLRDVRGRDFMTVRRYEELLTNQKGDFTFYGRADGLPHAYGLLAIAASATPAGVRKPPEPPHRARFVQTARVVSAREALTESQKSPRDEILLEEGEGGTTGSTGSARIAKDDTNEVVVQVGASGPGWLVLFDTWYPGWHAEIDGRDAPILRADYAFRAVKIEKTCTVRFYYSPLSRTLGLLLAVLGVVGLFVL